MADTKSRIERDGFGELTVPTDRYYGAQTARSLINFPIGEETMPVPLIRALGTVKQAAAIVNRREGRLSETLAEAIYRSGRPARARRPT